MNKLVNAFVMIIIGVTFVTVVAGSVTNYQYNANGWDIYTRETVRGSGIYYDDLINANILPESTFNTTTWDGINLTNYELIGNSLYLEANATNAAHYIETEITNTFSTNDKFYFKYEITGINNSRSLGLLLFSPTYTPAVAINTSTDGIKYSVTATPSTDSSITIIRIFVVNSNGDTVYSGNGTQKFSVSSLALVNLTNLYGVGNEPTADEIKSWYDDSNNLTVDPDDTLKTLDSLVTLFPVLFVIIVVAGAVLFIKSKQE